MARSVHCSSSRATSERSKERPHSSSTRPATFGAHVYIKSKQGLPVLLTSRNPQQVLVLNQQPTTNNVRSTHEDKEQGQGRRRSCGPVGICSPQQTLVHPATSGARHEDQEQGQGRRRPRILMTAIPT